MKVYMIIVDTKTALKNLDFILDLPSPKKITKTPESFTIYTLRKPEIPFPHTWHSIGCNCYEIVGSDHLAPTVQLLISNYGKDIAITFESSRDTFEYESDSGGIYIYPFYYAKIAVIKDSKFDILLQDIIKKSDGEPFMTANEHIFGSSFHTFASVKQISCPSS